jgi:Tfp pilus assembly protein PilW
MNLLISHPNRRRRLARAMTLVELMVASGLGSIVMAVVASLTIYGAHTFSAMGNYVDLDLHSRNALDVIGRELRSATAVTASQTNSPNVSVTLTNTDSSTGFTLTWNTNARTLVLTKSGQPAQTCLTECDSWSFALYNRAPNISATNITFNTATNLASCKLINMSWKCSRTILGAKLNTESVQTAQIVLRNKIH